MEQLKWHTNIKRKSSHFHICEKHKCTDVDIIVDNTIIPQTQNLKILVIVFDNNP